MALCRSPLIGRWHVLSSNQLEPQMLESTAAKSDLFSKMSAYLSAKSGPIRAERLPEHLLGVEYSTLSQSDKRIICGTLARCGFEQRKGDFPFFYRREAETEAAA
jgi:hypothetical protein